MIAIADMELRARSHLRSARILNRRSNAEHDAAAYLCGYAIEIALKACICRHLGWLGYPETPVEFQHFKSYRTHNLGDLLRLSGNEASLKSNAALLADWSILLGWNPEQRYERIGTKTAADTQAMTEAAARLLRFLL